MSQAKVIPFDNSTDNELAEVGDSLVLLGCSQAEAICRSVTPTYFAPLKQQKLVFSFTVISPEQYSGTKLEMFVRVDRRWKTPPHASKLYKTTCVAYGGHPPKGHKISKEMFLNKLFRCELVQAGTGPAAYTIVGNILEKLTS